MTYSDKVGENLPTVLLIPTVNRNLLISKTLVELEIKWECADTAKAQDSFPKLLGTLPSKNIYFPCHK